MRSSSQITQDARMYAGFCHSLVEDFAELITRKPHHKATAEKATAIGKRAEAHRGKIMEAIEVGALQEAEIELMALEQAWQEMKVLADSLPGT
jgi:hypothetical protein